MTAKEILQRARALIAKPGSWTQEAAARTAAEGAPVYTGSPEACSFCALGALEAARWRALEGVTCPEARDRVHELAVTAKRRLAAALPPGGVVRFNDEPGRTQAEVVAAFDRAIAGGAV